MTVAFGAIGTVTEDTDVNNVNVAYPSGITTGQRLILSVLHKVGGGSTVSTPSGWNTITNGESLVDDANRITVFSRTATGSESGSVSIAVGNGDLGEPPLGIAAWITRFTTTLGGWEPEVAGHGGDVGPSGSADWQVTTTQTIQRNSGDLLVAYAAGSGSSERSWSSETIAGASAVERFQDDFVDAGVNIQMHMSTAVAPSTANSTILHQANLNSNMAGPGLVMRMRDVVSIPSHTSKRVWGSIPIKADS